MPPSRGMKISGVKAMAETTPAAVPVTALGIRVTQHRAPFDRLQVVYYNGTTEEVNVRHRFAPGTTSRWASSISSPSGISGKDGTVTL